jgi:hypothetical protein
MYNNTSKTKMSKIFINVWRENVFDIHFTEFGAVMTTVLPVLFKYCSKSVNNRKTVKTVMTLTWYRHF